MNTRFDPHAPAVSGFLALDKPAGMTSREAVDHAQRWFLREKMGHAGTLDPAATGLLVIGVGMPATRLVEYVQQQKKVYQATIQLGASSTTDDGEGEITTRHVFCAPPETKIREKLAALTGTIQQVPPAYSAALIRGKRAHELARTGQTVALEPRAVTIYRFDLLAYSYPRLEVEVECGRGTYIRSLARDLGNALGIGGYVEFLRRTRIGPFSLEQAVSWEADGAGAREGLLPLELGVAHLPSVRLDSDQWRRVGMGQPISWAGTADLPAGSVAMWNTEVKLVGIGEFDPERSLLLPNKVFLTPGALDKE